MTDMNADARREASNKRFARYLLIVAFSAVGYAGLWIFVSDRMVSNLETWRQDTSQHTEVNVDWASTSASGFPFDVAVHVQQPVVQTEQTYWSTEEITLAAKIWDWSAVNFFLSEELVVSVTRNHRPETYVLRAESLKGRISGMSSDIITGTVEVVNGNLLMGGTVIGSVMSGRLETIRKRQDKIPEPSDTSGSLWFTLDGLDLPAFADSPLGARVEKVSAEIEARGGIPLPPETGTLLYWHDQGGTLEINSLRVHYNALSLHGEGTVALDAALQPAAAFTAKIQGYRQTIDGLQQAGVMDKGEAFTARLLLGALAREDGASRENTIEIPISIQDRMLSVGPLELLRLPPIHWSN